MKSLIINSSPYDSLLKAYLLVQSPNDDDDDESLMMMMMMIVVKIKSTDDIIT